ncbi:hypothetical protein D3C75_1237570 [compost metagenome]
MLLMLRIRHVDDVDQQIGFGHFLQRGAEGLDQMMGQLADEADRIGQQERFVIGQLNAAHGRLEGGEQHILGKHLFT